MQSCLWSAPVANGACFQRTCHPGKLYTATFDIAIPLAAGVLANWGVNLSPAVGAVLMSISTIVVAINAQLLRRVTF